MKIKKHKTGKKISSKKMSRKQAIKKTGIAALTASTMLFLDSQKASASSYTPTRPGRQ